MALSKGAKITTRVMGWAGALAGSVHPPAQTAWGKGKHLEAEGLQSGSLSSQPGRSRGDTLSHPGRRQEHVQALTHPGASGLSEAPGTFLWRPGVEDGDWAHSLVRTTRGSLAPTRAEHKVGWEASLGEATHAPAGHEGSAASCSHPEERGTTSPAGGAHFPPEMPANALLPLEADRSQLFPSFTAAQAKGPRRPVLNRGS